jgi:polysaccharide export outer membrane protein
MPLLLILLLLPAQAPAPPVPSGAPPRSAPQRGAPQDPEIGAEDILKVTVYGHDDLTLTLVVQPDGSFVYPLVGRVKAAELTTKELEQKLAVLLAQGFIRNPQVTVVVQESRSRIVHVAGEVARPGPYPLTASRTLMELLSRAGPLAAGAGTEVIVIRPLEPVRGPLTLGEASGGADGTPQAEVIRINLRDIEAGRLDRNVTLKPNDTVLVPAAQKIFVTGEVREPGAFSFQSGITVRQAISMAGGFSESASTGKLRIVRSIDGRAREIKVRIDDPVEPGDTILVKEKIF